MAAIKVKIERPSSWRKGFEVSFTAPEDQAKAISQIRGDPNQFLFCAMGPSNAGMCKVYFDITSVDILRSLLKTAEELLDPLTLTPPRQMLFDEANAIMQGNSKTI